MNPVRALWRTAVHPVAFVVICLLWCLDLGLGSLLAYQRPDIFGSMDACSFASWLRAVGRRALPWSAWVYVLAAGTSRLNNPLIAGATVVYPRGTEEVRTPFGTVLVGRYDVHHDPGVRLVLAGVALLFVGTLWAFGTYLAMPRLAPAAAPVSSSGP